VEKPLIRLRPVAKAFHLTSVKFPAISPARRPSPPASPSREAREGSRNRMSTAQPATGSIWSITYGTSKTDNDLSRRSVSPCTFRKFFYSDCWRMTWASTATASSSTGRRGPDWPQSISAEVQLRSAKTRST
jgi:hypothetical protein